MRTIYTPSTIDAATEEKLWKDAIIVFDTCALLDFYYMSAAHQDVMADILRYLSPRIWLPAQVVYEYYKNRESVILKPIVENYRDKELQGNHLVDDLKSYIASWEREYYHPFISDASLKSIKDALAVIEPKIVEIKTTVSKEYQARKNEIKCLKDNDSIEKAVKTLAHGNPFTYSEVMAICKEGAFRYANQIPPGYKDAESKAGIRQYGDLIIWKEILRQAKQQKRYIIFVTNDVKPDWSITCDDKEEKETYKPLPDEIGNPRRELLAEFEEETGQAIWFYNTSKFITKLEETYQPKQQEIAFYGQLGVVRDVLARLEREREIRQRHTGDALLIRCDKCGELFSFDAGDMEFDWQGGVVDDRGMGYEMEYDSQESCECPNCQNQIDLTLHVWEYPMGAFNYQDIDIEGGEIDTSINLEHYIDLQDYDTCERCGERAVVNSYGLCDQCEEEFRRFVNSDD
jgi:hypothetical protein